MTETGTWVISTQILNLGAEVGADLLVTEGFELADLNTPIERAITGGTGQHSTMMGIAVQETLGLNASGAPNIRVEFQFEN